MAATDLDKMIEKINYIRSQQFISSAEATDLKKTARDLANKKGELGPKDRSIINDKINQYLNKKGQAQKEETGLKPPSTTTTTPATPTKPSEPPKTNRPVPTAEDQRWNKFSSNWKKLNGGDKNIVRTVWPSAGADASAEKSFKNKSASKQQAFVDAVDGGNVTAPEKRELYAAFNRDKDGNPIKDGGGGGGGGGGGKQPGDGNDKEKDQGDKGTDGGLDDDGFDPTPDTSDDPDDSAPPEPTVKGGKKKVTVPKKPANRANYTVPKNSDERIMMPDVDRKITKEIQRITKRLINVTREYIEGGINFSGIDYIPEDEIYTESGESYFELSDTNTPGTLNNDLVNERLDQITEVINELLNKGRRGHPGYNYKEFMDLFELRYNESGTPVYRFSIELVGNDTEDISITLIEEDNNI